jgi:transposase
MKKEALNLSCIGLDCHRNFSLASARDTSGRIVWRERVEHADREALRERFGRWPKGTAVILEGTFGWGWISDELKTAGLDAHLSSGRKVSGVREARGMAKSNKKDADLLSELWGEKEHWWEVWCAPPEVRDLRELLRRRMSLVRMQTQLKNQIHATLHRHGLVNPFSDLFGAAGRVWLASMLEDATAPLRPMGRETLRGQLRILDQVRREVAQLTRQFRKTVIRHPAARRLMTLPGVSTVLGYTIVAEVGQIDRFKSGRCLSRYSVMAPMSDDSGDEREGAPIGRHVGKAGRLTLKWAWIEAARAAVRKSAKMRRVFDRYTNGGTRDRNRGYIAVGHQLCLIGYVLWKKDVDYTETPPPRPGSKPEPSAVTPGDRQTPPEQIKTRTSLRSGGCEAPLRKTPMRKAGLFCDENKKEKQNPVARPINIRDVSRPGTDQPPTALAAEHH